MPVCAVQSAPPAPLQHSRLARLLTRVQAARQRRRRQVQAFRAQTEQLDALLGELAGLTRALVQATLLVSGFHLHKGQWRKKRRAIPRP